MKKQDQTAAICRLRAKELLALPDMRLHLIMATVTFLTLWVTSVYISECTFNALPWERMRVDDPLRYDFFRALFYTLDGVIIVLIGLPLLIGTAGIFDAAARGVCAPLADMLTPFRSPRAYGRAQTLAARHLLLPCASLLPGLLLTLAAVTEKHVLYGCLGGALLLAGLFASLMLSGQSAMLLSLAFRNPATPLRVLREQARRDTRGRMLYLLRFRLTYIGWTILGIASFGLVLIFHALPLYSLSYTLYLHATDGVSDAEHAPNDPKKG